MRIISEQIIFYRDTILINNSVLLLGTTSAAIREQCCNLSPHISRGSSAGEDESAGNIELNIFIYKYPCFCIMLPNSILPNWKSVACDTGKSNTRVIVIFTPMPI